MIPLLKDIHKISHTSSPSTEEVVQKELVSGPLADLVEPPGEAEGKEDFPGGGDTDSSYLGSSIHLSDTASDKCPFGILSLNY